MTRAWQAMDRLRDRAVNILYFSSRSELNNGGQQSLLELVTRLDRSRFEPIVVVPAEGGLSWRLAREGIEVSVLPLPRVRVNNALAVALALRRLVALVHRKKVSLLHSDGPRNTFYGALAARMKGLPVTWHVRAYGRDRFDRLLSCLCDRIVLVAAGIRYRFEAGRGARRIVTIYNGVDLERFQPPQKMVSETQAASNGRSLEIVSVGRVEAQKGLLDLLQACGLMREKGKTFKLRVAGRITDPDYYRHCRSACESAGIEADVEFVGETPCIENLLSTADVFVLPSSTPEAFPRTVIEAMACGRAVVATDVGGTREAVIDGVCGFLVPPGRPDLLASKLTILKEDAALRLSMGRAGRLRTERLFGIEKNVARIMRLYEELLAIR